MRSTFKQHDLTRAIRAAEAAGKVVAAVDLDRGGPRLIFDLGATNKTPSAAAGEPEAWDEE